MTVNRKAAVWILTLLDEGVPAGVCNVPFAEFEQAAEVLDGTDAIDGIGVMGGIAALGLEAVLSKLEVELPMLSIDSIRVVRPAGDDTAFRASNELGCSFRSGGGRWSGIVGGEPNRRVRFWLPIEWRNGQPHEVCSLIARSESEAIHQMQMWSRVGKDGRAYEVVIELPDLSADSAYVVRPETGEWRSIEAPKAIAV